MIPGAKRPQMDNPLQDLRMQSLVLMLIYKKPLGKCHLNWEVKPFWNLEGVQNRLGLSIPAG